MAAKAIHQASLRKDMSFVTVECAGLTETLFESELFGHAWGAFTGASYHKQGLVDAANGGTLFLDEIGDIPLAQQVKLLRLIETGTYRQLGSIEALRADFRLICATHKNLKEMVQQGLFREDLYYRINVFTVHLPSLSERAEDIPLIARSLLAKVAPQQPHTLTAQAEVLSQRTIFNGKIRELRNILERAVLLSRTAVIDENLLLSCLDDGLTAGDTEATLHDEEREHVSKLLREFKGNKQAVADHLNISLRTFYRELR
jgi:transcriptional regulator with PAS, ATPase and Fis domain